MSEISSYIVRKFETFLSWRSRKVNDQAFLFTLAFLTGVVSGAFAALLKVVIRHISLFWTSGMHIHGVNIPLLAIPVVGILLTGIYQRYVIHANLTHGSRRLSADLAAGNYSLPSYLTYAPMVASSLTLGFGGSAGSEGPIAYTGAAVGSNIGKLFRVSPRMMMIMVGCGAGAGIAGIFKAPMGGALFTLEVLKMQLTTMSVMALILACVTSAMTAYVLSGYTVDLSYVQMHQFDASVAPWIVGLGIVCGLYSVYYSYIMALMDCTYGRIRNPWIKNGLSGLVLAVLLFIFPAMYGEGYGMMGHLLNGDLHAMINCSAFSRIATDGWPIVLVAGGIVLTKCFAASASNCGGGVAGDFAPTLFAGCILGFFFASSVNLIFGLDLPVSGFAFMGMAGVMSGAIRAPFMALFLTVEMTNGFILFLPLLVVAAISYGVVRLFNKPVYYKE
ncbi:MAG: chloride channel protein [Paramuribaculum sp.]|nr:chloride channel protein [Paramuribaculum sp.]